MELQQKHDILGLNSVSVDQNFIIKVTNENKESFDEKAQKICKVISFTNPELKSWEIFEIISKLQSETSPNLFTFVIKRRNFGFCATTNFKLPEKVEKVHRCLLKFDENRSMILQLTSFEENITKIYYKEEGSKEFLDIDDQIVDDENCLNFRSFLFAYLKGGIEQFEILVAQKWPRIKHSSLISKFMGIFHNSESFTRDLLAVNESLFDEKGEIQEYNLKAFLSSTERVKEFLMLSVKTSNHKIIRFLGENCSNLIQQIPFQNQVQISETAFSINQKLLCDLLELCDFPFPKNSNLESITNKRLLEVARKRIEFHKKIISENPESIEDFSKNNPNLKLAYNLENKSALSNALDSKIFKSFFLLKALRFQDNDIENVLSKLDNEEDQNMAFKVASVQRRENVNISTADKDLQILLLETRSFIYSRKDNNPEEPKQREKIKQWYKDIYKSEFGSKIIDVACQCKDIKIIFDFECASVKDIDVIQTSQSTGAMYPISKWIFIGAMHTDSPEKEQKIKGVIVHEMCHYVMRMVYQNNECPYYKDDNKAKEEFEKIVNEIEEMCKFYPEYDQEELMEEDNGDNCNQNSDPEVDQVKSTEEVNQVKLTEEIKNHSNEVESREENNDNVSNDDNSNQSSEYDYFEYIDECNTIISAVYNCYSSELYHIELIVRPAQIQVEFNNDEMKLEQIELKYKILFKFFEDFVVPELKKFCLEQRKNVQTFNDIIGLMSEVRRSKLKFQKLNDVSDILISQVTVITTNVPKLLLLNLYIFLYEKYEDLMEIQNIFMNSEALKNSYILKSFKEILKQESTLNIIADCSSGFRKISKFVTTESKHIKFVFVVQNENDCEELCEILEDNEVNPIKLTFNYNWNDLEPKSHQLLLRSKINFQNNSEFSLSELISENFEEIIDNRLLKLLVERSEISINSLNELETNEKHFKILFQSRDLIKVEIEEELINDDGNSLNKAHNNSFLKKFLNLHKFISNKITKQLSIGETSTKVQLIEKTEKMSYTKMLKDVRTSKVVLISDKAGSGKSWMLKNFTNKLKEEHPTKWICYIDLKQFIDKFRSNNIYIEFEIFMVEKILKPRQNYEAEIFKHLYRNGKVCIIFDGFDEIAPDCAELVTKLFQSFEQNGGNQMWIATRDYFEVDLKKDLQLDVVYKLDEFTEEQGVNLITLSWLLREIEERNEDLSINDLIEQMNRSENREIYGRNAEGLSSSIPKAQTNSIGFPQFYKMMADISKHNESSALSRTTFRMFKTCVKFQYEKWSTNEGKLRSDVNVESQERELNFYKLHQLIAIESLFPGESVYCDLHLEDLNDWPIEEIISCGLVCRRGNKYFFTHETIREFFAAMFILRLLIQRQINDNVCKYLIQFLTIQKYGIIRMFLNEAFGEASNIKKIIPKMEYIKDKFGDIRIFEKSSEVFEEGLQHLANFLIKIFKMSSTKRMKDIIFLNKKIIIFAAKYKELLFIPLQEFIFENLSEFELKLLLLDDALFLSIIVEIQDDKLTQEFLYKVLINVKAANFIQKLIKIHDDKGDNLLFYLVRSQSINPAKIQGIFKILKVYLDPASVMRLVQEKSNGITFLQACVSTKNLECTRTVLEELLIVFGIYQSSYDYEFMNFLKQKDMKFGKNVLHISAECDNFEFHKMIWEFLLKLFNSVNLLHLMMQTDKNEYNYVDCLIYFNNSEVIKKVFAMFKVIFNNNQFIQITRSKGFDGKNLLQKVLCVSKDIQKIQVVIDIFRNSCMYNWEFFNLLQDVDLLDNSIIHTAAMHSTKEVFEFLISIEEIKQLLSSLGFAEQNIFQSARCNKFLEFHAFLWETMKAHHDPLEIFEMIIHPDVYGDSLILNVIEYNTKDIAELTWNEIRKVLLPDEEYTDLSELWIECNDHFNSFLENKDDNSLKQILRRKLMELINLFKQVDYSVKLSKLLDPENELQNSEAYLHKFQKYK